MELERQNPHWNSDFFYPYEKKRVIFDSVKASVESGLITAIYGLRRVGKSVVMKQVINDVIRSGVDRLDIFYFSFDEEKQDFWSVVKEFEKKTGKIEKRHYLFFDEVQKVPDWKAKIKVLFDSTAPHIIVTGSNSTLVRKGSESLAGRINEFIADELSFREFLYFKNKNNVLESQLGEQLEILFWEYLKKPFPELVVNERIEPETYVKTITRKTIYEDLPAAFPIKEPQLLDQIFSIICKSPGLTVEFNALSSDLGRNRRTIANYFEYLKYGFLVRQLFNYSKNALTSQKKLKKFYPSLACFTECEDSKKIETAACQAVKPKFFWNYKNQYEVDFVIDNPLTGFEVKYKDKLSSEDWTGLKKFNLRYPNATTAMVSKKEGVPYYELEQFMNNIKR